MSSEFDPNLANVVAFARRLRRCLALVEIVAATLNSLSLLLILALATVCVEHAMFLNGKWRLGLMLVSCAATVGLVAVQVVWRLRGRLSWLNVGLIAERRLPKIRGRFINALELSQRGAPQIYSPGLLASTVRGAAACIANQSPMTLIGWNPVHRAARRIGGALAVVVTVTALFANDLEAAAIRCTHPLTDFERTPKTHIDVFPADLEVVRGDDAAIAIHFSGDLPRTAEVSTQDTSEGVWPTTEIAVTAAPFDSQTSVHHTFSDVMQPFAFSVHSGDGVSGPHSVAVIDPPEVQKLTLRYHYPEYSGLNERIEMESGDISALAGTRVTVHIDASKPLAEATLVINDSLNLSAEIEDRSAQAVFTLPVGATSDTLAEQLSVHRPRGQYRIHIRDRKGIANRDPILYSIEVLPDHPPQVAIVAPGTESDLPESQAVNLSVEASDDFGITTGDLLFNINGEIKKTLVLPVIQNKQIAFQHLWDLTDLDLLPEDRVTYQVRMTDNDTIGGPKSALSEKYTLQFPSLFELLDEVSDLQEESMASLEEVIAQERNTQDYLEQVRREVLRSEDLTWEQKNELEAALDRQRERAQALEGVAQELAEVAEKLSEQGLSSQQLLDKMAEIRTLMEEVTSPELMEALQELQQSADELDTQNLAETLKEFGEEYKLFEERLDRTLALLRQVQAEHQLAALVEKARDLFSRQQAVDASLAKSGGDAPYSSQKSSHLSKREKTLARDAEYLRNDLQEASLGMAPISPRSSLTLAKEAVEMGQMNMSGRMHEMAERLANNQPRDARRLGQALEEDLGVLVSDLEHLQGQFAANGQAQIADQLHRAMADLIRLSHNQETLGQTTKRKHDGHLGSALADEQFALQRGADVIIQILAAASHRTLSLNPAVAVSVSYARGRMQEAGHHLGQRELKRSLKAQSQAYSYLNEGANLLRESIADVAASFMPSGFAEAMQKLMGLSEQQAALNQTTQDAMSEQATRSSRHGSGDGGDLRSEMARVAAEQRRIMQAMAEIERNMRGHRGAEKRIQAIAKDMNSVLHDMQRRKPHPRIQQTQERIYQRMLDVSRSIYSRGFDKKRRSTAGLDRAYVGPIWIPHDLGQRPDAWRNAMKRALAGQLPTEYRELVRRYYESVYDDISEQPESPSALP